MKDSPNKISFAMGILLVVGIHITKGQDNSLDLKDLVYANDYLNASDLFVLEEDLLMINTTQDSDHKLYTVLLNRSNILKDTLFPGLLVYQVYKDQNEPGRYNLFGKLQQYNFNVEDDKIQLAENVVKQDFNPGYFATVFNDKLVSCIQDKKNVRILLYSKDQNGFFSRSSKYQVIYEKRNSFNLKKKFINQLPFSFGLDDNLYVFIRDEQKLLKITKDWIISDITIKIKKGSVFSYFFDAGSQMHFFIETSTDEFYNVYTLDLGANRLKFLSEIKHHPITIFDMQYYYCSGSRKMDCDYYKRAIFEVDNEPDDNILEDVTIDRNY